MRLPKPVIKQTEYLQHKTISIIIYISRRMFELFVEYFQILS